MTCADARHFILTADPSALRTLSDARFREHVAGCAPCAAAAGHVVTDVARLRAALITRGSRTVPVRPRRSTKRVVMTLVPMALAAELAFFAFLGSRDSANPILDKPVMMDDTVSMLRPIAQTYIDTGEVTVTPAPARKASTKAPVVAAKDDSTADADSVAKIGSSAVPPSLAVLQVTSAPRQKYAVIATSNPKITVVWITKGDSL